MIGRRPAIAEKQGCAQSHMHASCCLGCFNKIPGKFYKQSTTCDSPMDSIHNSSLSPQHSLATKSIAKEFGAFDLRCEVYNDGS